MSTILYDVKCYVVYKEFWVFIAHLQLNTTYNEATLTKHTRDGDIILVYALPTSVALLLDR